ncbi:hypothetical protein [Vreelandella venusta]|uniref:hypothetical protein n=1 Tax=Vreelandella venusta TaxID=44935 RepID=UPI003F668A60
MSLQAPKTITEIFTANSISTAFVIALMQCQELALAVNLKRKYAVQFETCQHGIFCDTWLADRNAQHESHCKVACFYTQPSAVSQIHKIHEHLTALLHESAGGDQ